MDEYIKLYFQYHIILLVFLLLAILILFTDLGIKKKAKINLGVIIGIIFVASIVHIIERYVCEETNNYPNFRFGLTVIKYLSPQIILCLLMTTIFNDKKVMLINYILLGIEAILLSTSQFTHLVYYVAPDNTFTRSYLWFIPFVFSFFYLISFMGMVIYKFKSDKFELIFLLASPVLCTIITILEAFDIIKERLNTALGASVLFYEMYLFYVNSKKDVLTGLLNRHSFIRDMKNKKDRMSALISMDLNGLKTINDTMGHQAGDEAIIAAAKSFTSVKGYKYKVYRVGGDEFNAIIFNATEDNIKEIISNMNEYAIKLGYSISFGYSMNDKNYSIDELIKYADSDMYNSKKEYYEEINKKTPNE